VSVDCSAEMVTTGIVTEGILSPNASVSLQKKSALQRLGTQ
jgi:hypothetical protein